MKPARRIVLAFWLHYEPGRRKIGGFLDRVRELRLPWQFYIVRTPSVFTEAFADSLPERKIDGVVFSMPDASDGAAALARLDIPVVAVDLFGASLFRRRSRAITFIDSSSDEIGRAAARNLMAQGCFKSYGYVADQFRSIWGRERGEAFIDEIRRNRLPVSRYGMLRRYDLPLLAQWLRRLPKPAGIFAAYDDRAIQVVEACHEAGLAIPSDIAVVGVDNDEMVCTNSTPMLTSVQPDHVMIGRLAADSLAEMLDGQISDAPVRKLVGVREIAVRESTGATSSAGRLVQQAIAFMRMHAMDGIKPRDVAAHLNVSRSLADLRFRELQGESMGSAILRHRLEAVRRLLLTTNDTIEDIADKCNFRRAYRLRDAFKARYGCTMVEYRDKFAH